MKRWIKPVIVMVFSMIAIKAIAAEKTKEVPFYFPVGVVEATDPMKQLQEFGRHLAATHYRFQGNRNLVPGSDSYSVETNIESTSCSLNNKKPTKMKLVLDHYVRMADGKIRVTFLDDQVFITEQQLKVVVNDMLSVVNKAADYNHAYYGPVADATVKARAEKLGVPEDEFRKILDKEVPGYGITFRELHRLPAPMRRSDFVPREVHLGYNALEGILGVTWLNTGIIYYNPQARILDYVVGKPLVMQHEMIHNNVNLQNFPASVGFDMELMAEIPIALYSEDQLSLLFHGYNKDLRELIWIYFGFNFQQVRSDIVKYDLAGNLLIDEEKFREYSVKLQNVKDELYTFFQEVMIPEFYSDPVWWSAMNERRRDNNSLFRIMLAGHYDPTILGGRAETMKWLEIHKAEILEIAKDAYQKSAGTGDEMEMFGGRVPSVLYDWYQKSFSEEERSDIQQYFKDNPEIQERISKMNLNELIEFFGKFKKQGGVR